MLVMAALAVFARNFVTPAAPTRWYCGRMAFFVLLGLTQLVKGPLFGAVMALLPCVGFIFWQRCWSAWRWLLYWPGIVVALLIATAWPAAILLRYPDAAEVWWLHTFGRFNEHGILGSKPAWYYLSTLPWQIAPWTLLVFVAWKPSWLRAWRKGSAADRFLWLWLVLPLAALSSVAGKHPHYLIYALPPCSFWAAEGLIQLARGVSRFLAPARRLAMAIAVGLLAFAGLVAVASLVQIPFSRDVLLLCGIVTMGLAITAWSCRRRAFHAAAVGLFASLGLAVLYLHGSLQPRTDPFGEENNLYRALGERGTRNTPLLVYRMDPAQALFYRRGPVEFVGNLHDLKAQWPAAPRALLITQACCESELREVGSAIRLTQTTPSRQNPEAQFVVLRLEQAGIVSMAQRSATHSQPQTSKSAVTLSSDP
jgi:4-amino-4-deoxy-L-arabinose transferase-like glycosyltransferase